MSSRGVASMSPGRGPGRGAAGAGEGCRGDPPDVDTAVLVAMMTGSVLQMAVTSGRRGVDDAWVTAMVSVLLHGIRPSLGPDRVQREKGLSSS